jgi:hypothetical protein
MALTPGYGGAAFPQKRVVALRESRDELIGGCGARRGPYLRRSGGRIAIGDVVGNGRVEQH